MRLKNGEVLFIWPLVMHIITAGWTYNDGSAHNAIDLRAAVGTPVYAAEDGTVNWVQHWHGGIDLVGPDDATIRMPYYSRFVG